MINLPNKVEKYPIYPLKLKKKRENKQTFFNGLLSQPLHKYIPIGMYNLPR